MIQSVTRAIWLLLGWMELALFTLFAALAVIFGLVVVIHPDPVKSTMSMVVTLFSLAVLFFMLGAPFLGALQVLLYTGAILVLFLFVIMLLNVERLARVEGGRLQRLAALAASAFFIGPISKPRHAVYPASASANTA